MAPESNNFLLYNKYSINQCVAKFGQAKLCQQLLLSTWKFCKMTGSLPNTIVCVFPNSAAAHDCRSNLVHNKMHKICWHTACHKLLITHGVSHTTADTRRATHHCWDKKRNKTSCTEKRRMGIEILRHTYMNSGDKLSWVIRSEKLQLENLFNERRYVELFQRTYPDE